MLNVSVCTAANKAFIISVLQSKAQWRGERISWPHLAQQKLILAISVN